MELCRVEEQVSGTPCGSSYCNEALGEECIAGKLCGCPKGQKRKDANSPCRVVSGKDYCRPTHDIFITLCVQVESFNLPLYVIRDGQKEIKFTPAIANPRDDLHKDLVGRQIP